MNQITTHVLDTSRGKPAEGIRVRLQKLADPLQWETVAEGVTNANGRIPDFVPAGKVLPPGIYRMYFDTGPYFTKQGVQGFYPYVPVIFETQDTSHHHVPLLLNPYGYSTYRGS